MKIPIISCFMLLWTLMVCAQNGPQDLTGTKAQKFELIDIDGNIISSDNTKGKVVVLNFWFIGCKPCLKEIPELNAVYQEYAQNQEVVFASIALDNLENVRKKMSKYNIQYPIVTDGDPFSKLFKVNGFPTNIVIDKERNYFFRFTGGLPGIGDYISNSIQKALEQ
ncbi:MAG: TlpA disulfide reductase family protein [Bacteroidota bacterium]